MLGVELRLEICEMLDAVGQERVRSGLLDATGVAGIVVFETELITVVDPVGAGDAGCGSGASHLLQVFPRAALSHHFEEQILDDHQEEQHLPLLTPGHARQHLQKFGIDLLSKGQAVIGKVRHARLAPDFT